MRNTKTDLEELGEEMTSAKYDNLIQALTDYNVKLVDINGEYRSTYAIMQDIAAQWDRMTSMEQAALAEAIAGNRQQAVFYSLIENMDQAEKAMKSMSESSGVLGYAYAVVLKTVESHVQSFKSAWSGVGVEILNALSPIINLIIDVGTSLSSVVEIVAKLAPHIATVLTPAVNVLSGAVEILSSMFNVVADALGDANGAFDAFLACVVTLKFAMSQNWIGVFIGAMTTLAMVVDAATVSYKELQQQIEDSDAKIADINEQLTTTQERIDELESADSLSFVEEQELEDLRTTNELLAIQLDLEKDINAEKRKALTEAAERRAKAFIDNDYLYDPNLIAPDGTAVKNTSNNLGGLKNALADYIDAVDEYNSAVEKYSDAAKKGESVNASYLYSLNKNLSQRETVLIGFKETIVSMMEDLDPDSGSYKDLLSYFDEIARTLGDTDYFERLFGDLPDKTQKSIDGLIDKAKELGWTVEELGDQLDALSSSDSDLKEWFDRSGYSAESLAAYLYELSESAEKNAIVASQNAEQWGLTAVAVDKAAENYNELSEILSGDDWDAGFKNASSAFEKMMELVENGDVGSKKLGEIAQYLGAPDASNADEWQAWADRWVPILGDAENGIYNFLDLIQELNTSGELDPEILKFDGEDFYYNANLIAEAADILGISADTLTDLIGGVRMKSADWDVLGTPQENLERLINSGVFEQVGDKFVATEEQIKKSLASAGNYTEEQIDTIIESLKTLDNVEIKSIGDEFMDALNSEDWKSQLQTLADTYKINLEVDASGAMQITQDLIDGLLNAGATAEEVEGIISDLVSKGATLDTEVTINGQPLDSDGHTTIGVDIDNDESGNVTLTVNGATLDGNTYDITVTANEGSNEVSISIVPQTDTSQAEVSTENLTGALEVANGKVSELSSRTIGTLGAGATEGALNLVKNVLDKIKNTVIPDKYFTVHEQHVVTTTTVVKHAKGTKNAQRGMSLLGDEYSPSGSPKPELVVTDNGAYIAGQNGPTLGYLNQGDVVYTADETEEILKGSGVSKLIPAFSGGTITKKKLTSGMSSGSGSYGTPSPTPASSSSGDKDAETWFERQYKDYNHWLEMDQALTIDYLNWLQNAYQQAYGEGIIDIDEYYKYQEEVYKGLKELDEDAKEEAKDNLDDLIKYRMKMIKQDLKNEKDSLNERLSYIKDFVDAQKNMLSESNDEKQYLEEQAELRKTVTDLEIELSQLQGDNSAWAERRKLELNEDLAEARKELTKFEQDYALDQTMKLLDDAYTAEEKTIQARTEAIDKWLENEANVYNKALVDVQNNSTALFEAMKSYERYYGDGEDSPVVEMWEEAYIALKNYANLFGEFYKGIDLVNATDYDGPIPGYATGTSSATPGLHKLFENGDEYIFSSADGNRYKMFSGGEKVLNATETGFLFNFAKTGSSALINMIKSMTGDSLLGKIGGGVTSNNINMGDIIVQGSASDATVSAIRRAQRDNVDYMLKEINRLKK